QVRVAEIKGARRGMVTVATTSGLAGSLLPSLVHDFRQHHPGIVVRVADLPVAGIVAAVEQGDADLGLGYDLPEVAAFRVMASRDWSIGAVVAPGHPLAMQPSTRLAECAGYPLILPAPSLSIRALVDDAFARQSVEVTPAVESTSVVLIQRLAAAGVGVALLNPLDVMDERARGAVVFVPLRDSDLRQQALRMVARVRAPLSPAAELMAERIGTALDGLFR
ncbi:MAG TPA: LysR family transcriptional regulator, partial [Cupriavidus sp.]|nr:LysR family transcriptional regulator [Cupriavidus sp.]